MDRRNVLKAAAAAALLALPCAASAQDTVKIGLIVPMTGQQASTGKQIKAAVELYMKEHGDTVAGKKIEVILQGRRRGVPDNTKRLAQELIVNDKVSVIAGFERHAGRARGRAARDRGEGAGSGHGRRHLDHHRALALYRAHQLHAAAVFRDHRRLGGQERHQEGRHHRLRLRARRGRREIVHASASRRPAARCRRRSRCRCANPDFAPFLQRAADAKPDAIFVFVPSGPGRHLHEAVSPSAASTRPASR